MRESAAQELVLVGLNESWAIQIPAHIRLVVVGCIKDEENRVLGLEFTGINHPASLNRLSIIPGSTRIPLLRD